MRLFTIALCLICALSLLAGCSPRGGVPAAAPTPTAGQETSAELPNPVKEASADEIAERFGVVMKAPENAEELSYTIIDGETPLAQLSFLLDGAAYTYRIARAPAYRDISGMYYEWQEISVEEDEDGSIRLIDGGAGVYDRFDAAEGTVYSLSMDSGASPDALTEMAGLLWGEPSETELAALLDALRTRYFPGTAGSSLRAAACAAELADFFAESGMHPDTADRVVRDCRAALSPEDAQLFEQQLDGVVSAFSSLTGEGGAGLLSDCGYTAAHFPWNDENVRNCFVALLGSD